ncbi:hypothetical protein HU200_002811 [Digitaria exilis]|uniref:Uncharacterized protein n=1 Tax=Digitaria exilis TaxID=1010633 RepID=A0A835FVY6_9POAL|nr:hypothetical protein HU200_002811 [Digitaria exilis]
MTETAAPAAWFFLLLAFVGGVYVAAFSFRFFAYAALCLHRPRDLRRRYGAWAVVTGPTSGIGRSMALELARRGLNLVLLDLDAANLRETSDVIRSRHAVKTRTVVFDLSLVGTPQGDVAIRRLRAAIEGLDVGVLVNNAGVSRPSSVYLHEADVEALLRMIRVNLWALTEVTAAVLPGMVERGRGAVVNMGSASSEAIPSFPLNTIYAATKRYVAAFSRSLYVEYRSKGIDVKCQVNTTNQIPHPATNEFCGSYSHSVTSNRVRCAAGPILRGDQDGVERHAGLLAVAVRPHAGRLRKRRLAGSATARSAPPPSATSCSGASPASCRTPRTTGSVCATTCA